MACFSLRLSSSLVSRSNSSRVPASSNRSTEKWPRRETFLQHLCLSPRKMSVTSAPVEARRIDPAGRREVGKALRILVVPRCETFFLEGSLTLCRTLCSAGNFRRCAGGQSRDWRWSSYRSYAYGEPDCSGSTTRRGGGDSQGHWRKVERVSAKSPTSRKQREKWGTQV